MSTPSRRDFAKQLGTGIAATLLVGSSSRAATPAQVRKPAAPFSTPVQRVPDRVFVQDEHGTLRSAERAGDRFTAGGVAVACDEQKDGVAVKVHCPTGPLSRIVLRWNGAFNPTVRLLGDAWERSYGDLQWRPLQPERVMPWYFAVHDVASGATFCAGVMTQPAGLCFWTADADGISLWLDLRNGGSPSLPGDRVIAAATLVSLTSIEGESPFHALRRFCRVMSPRPRLAPTPICGNNNWYYAYGHGFDANAMRRDAAFLAELAEGATVRPYCVIDAGWSPGGSCPGGPWRAGKSDTFPDMAGLAADMKRTGVRPGLWIRPSALSFVDHPARLRPGPVSADEKPLDLTLPENLEAAREDLKRVRGWGYELIKHDFSTYDLFGRWGFEMGAEITDSGWSFHDRSLTNAEIVLNYYRALRAGAGDAVLLGCNTIGHLGAGVFEIQRIGDDTSGHVWERTRRMGVNTLAYRLVQHGAFFACDPDCAPHTEQTPWELDRQFLDLVARSGAPLFVSADPRTVTTEQKARFRSAMQTALALPPDQVAAEPLDWMESTTPRRWKLQGETVAYDWSEPFGASPFKV